MNTPTFALATLVALADGSRAPTTLQETRVTMDKWIETQQIISRERKDWEQGKEILTGRLELVKNEIALLQVKIQEAKTGVEAAERKRSQLRAEDEHLVAAMAELTEAVTRMESELATQIPRLPDPIRSKLETLIRRIPEDPATTKVTTPERFQNVLGILNEVNRANNEISVNYEVRELADGKPSEVQAIYLGLAQAYYVSGAGEAGIGRPGAAGWEWKPAKSISRDVLMSLEILQGKHTPAFVPLPVTLQ
jgi:hypothetical protein